MATPWQAHDKAGTAMTFHRAATGFHDMPMTVAWYSHSSTMAVHTGFHYAPLGFHGTAMDVHVTAIWVLMALPWGLSWQSHGSPMAVPCQPHRTAHVR